LGDKSERFYKDGYDFKHCKNHPESLREHPTAKRLSRLLSRKSTAASPAEADGDVEVDCEFSITRAALGGSPSPRRV